jgi:hypothetical protein
MPEEYNKKLLEAAKLTSIASLRIAALKAS